MSKFESEADQALCYGCLFCRVGMEQRVVDEIARDHPELKAIVPVKLRYHRIAKVVQEERVTLFPGYVFIRAGAEFDAFACARYPYVYRLLVDVDRNWRLCGADEALARALFAENGVIGFSKAYYENDRIRIVDGFLKAHEGRILRVNRRMRTVEIALSFQDKDMKVWLGFDLIEKKD